MAELQAVLAHPQFANSKRYPSLLRYLVEHTLAGDVDHIKERTLGVEVFGRPATYDTTNDTVVRFTASEVRRRLNTFYLQSEERPIQIALPVGSYVPEFLRDMSAEEEHAVQHVPALHPAIDSKPAAPTAPQESSPLVQLEPEQSAAYETTAAHRISRLSSILITVAVALAVCGSAAFAWYRMHPIGGSAVDRFWQPFARDSQKPLLIVGGNIFSDNLYSGTETATSDVDYPFVSIQIASAMTRVSSQLQREGSSVDVKAANGTTLNDLRDRPLILIGGYNNQWTKRLTSALPLRLTPAAAPAIQDSARQAQVWQRDRNQPYNSSDDYALIGRYRDTTTGNMVALIAGIGRNGSEAAAQFLTDERRMGDLERQVGKSFDRANFEAVLRVQVIQGKTGAPTLISVRSW
ncbi:hypothetical protein [Terriglobus aquaticus]|nr:hypothetical protein [Terriglobus aquaticus]